MTTDETLQAIGAAVAAGRSGDADGARRALLDLWSEIGVLGEPLHRCTLAHHLADLHPHAAEALVWDVRALDAAEAAGGIPGFAASLHLNLADDFRRLAAFDVAADHLAAAERVRGEVPAGEYGDLMATALRHVRGALSRRDTAALPSHPGVRS